MTPEKHYENQVKEFLKNNEAWYIKYWSGSKFTQSGIPDIIASIGGHFVAIETKSDRGIISELQKYNIQKIRESGGFAFALYPSGFTDFKRFVVDLQHDTFDKINMPLILK